jgi:hypothetical protein
VEGCLDKACSILLFAWNAVGSRPTWMAGTRPYADGG